MSNIILALVAFIVSIMVVAIAITAIRVVMGGSTRDIETRRASTLNNGWKDIFTLHMQKPGEPDFYEEWDSPSPRNEMQKSLARDGWKLVKVDDKRVRVAA